MPILPLAVLAAVCLVAALVWSGRAILLALRGRRAVAPGPAVTFTLAAALLVAMAWLLHAVLRGLSR